MKTLSFPLVALTLALAACGAPEVDDPSADVDALGGKADSARTGRFETFTGEDGRVYFHLLAGNGEKVLASQGYASADSAKDGLDTVRFNGAHAEAYQLLQAQDGQWYFNLLAGNFETIATSELYVSQANAERAITTVTALVARATTGAAATGAKFQAFRGLDGKYYFHLRAGNGQIVLQSQGYTRKSSALDGTASVQSNGVDLRRYEVRDAADGQAYFVLKAGNGQVIGLSETYASRANAEHAVAGVSSVLQGSVAAAQ